MPKPDFHAFRSNLCHLGVASRHVKRASAELQDHYEDLLDEALINRIDRATAEQRATAALGDLGAIALDISSRPELSSWAFRYPKIAIVAYPLMCIAVMPAVPVIAGVANAPMLARWGASLLFGAAATAALLLFMQLSITLT